MCTCIILYIHVALLTHALQRVQFVGERAMERVKLVLHVANLVKLEQLPAEVEKK